VHFIITGRSLKTMDELKRTVKYMELIDDIKNKALYDKDLKGSFKASLISEILKDKKYRYLTLTSKEISNLFDLLWKN
jgi:hypothetical protein